MNANDIAVRVTLSRDDAQVLHWFLRHMAFDSVYARTPPHLGRELRKERTYAIMAATSKIQSAIEAAEIFGDGWMYGP